MKTAIVKFEPCPSTAGSTGHGEGVEFENEYYYYTLGKKIPRNKAASLVAEGCYLGRVRGEKNWIIVAWNGQSFDVLEEVYGCGIKAAFEKFRNKTPEEARKIHQDLQDSYKKIVDALPRCKCGSIIIVLERSQSKKLCTTCFRNSK